MRITWYPTLRTLITTFAVMSFVSLAAAESVVVVPESSRLALARYDGESHDASFRGTERISGRFAIAWRNENDEDLLEIRFAPDGASQRRLPSDPGQSDMAITVTNRDVAVLRLVGRETAARILEGELAAIEGTATLVIGDVETGIDDGARWWQAAILSVERAKVEREWAAVDGDDDGDGGC